MNFLNDCDSFETECMIFAQLLNETSLCIPHNVESKRLSQCSVLNVFNSNIFGRQEKLIRSLLSWSGFIYPMVKMNLLMSRSETVEVACVCVCVCDQVKQIYLNSQKVILPLSHVV